ncbi:MAG: hypothetical protein LBD99_02395 [Candidatus Margulisbacteria bacterium]|jgi:hypothetical protein|nr:hypothetical protein [Candidatus Margulisiibacteriota bacterium]
MYLDKINIFQPDYRITRVNNSVRVEDRLEQFRQICEFRKYTERLGALSQNEWDKAGWYLSLITQVLEQGENCAYLNGRAPEQKIAALNQLEKEIEDFLKRAETN